MVGQAFTYSKAAIDRSLFRSSGGRVDCSDTFAEINDAGERTACWGGATSGDIDVDALEVYSDHWAIWTDVNRRACAKTDCAASK